MWAILKAIIEKISPEIREALGKLLDDLEAKAKLTSNLWDDVIVYVLKKALGF